MWGGRGECIEERTAETLRRRSYFQPTYTDLTTFCQGIFSQFRCLVRGMLQLFLSHWMFLMIRSAGSCMSFIVDCFRRTAEAEDERDPALGVRRLRGGAAAPRPVRGLQRLHEDAARGPGNTEL